MPSTVFPPDWSWPDGFPTESVNRRGWFARAISLPLAQGVLNFELSKTWWGNKRTQYWYDVADPAPGVVKTRKGWYVWPAKVDYSTVAARKMKDRTYYPTREAAMLACQLIYGDTE